MTKGDDYTPDEPLGTEAFEQGDEALDEQERTEEGFDEEVEQDPSLDPTLQLDDRELEEAGVKLDEPENLVTLEGGIDDPDGLDEPSRFRSKSEDDEGWDLDEPLALDEEDDEEEAP